MLTGQINSRMVDISKNMLACAADRLVGLSNVRLVHLPAANLDPLSDNSFDLVYLTNMFDHLDAITCTSPKLTPTVESIT